MSDRFNWSSDYSVGNQILDGQHKILFNLCAEALNLLKDEDIYSSKAFQCLMDEICEKAKQHFDTEERLLDEYNFPDYRSHREEHYDFLTKLAELILDHSEKKLDRESLIQYLHSWFVDHIVNQDMKYKPYVIGR